MSRLKLGMEMAEMVARKKGCQLNDGAVTAAAEEKEATDKIVKRSFFWLMPKEIFQFRTRGSKYNCHGCWR